MQNIQISRSIKRKTVAIQILPDGSIKVSTPYFFPKSQIEKLLREKEEWITHHQQLMQSRTVNKKADEENYLYLGKEYSLEIRQNQKSIVEVSDKLYIASTNKTYAKKYLLSWYKQQARKIISERTQQYAKRAGLEFKSIAITSAETRWGSCSSQKTLNFNWKLIMAPLPVMDYVIAHELAHLVELNHSRDFWEQVRKIFPLYREYRTWLKRYGHTLRV